MSAASSVNSRRYPLLTALCVAAAAGLFLLESAMPVAERGNLSFTAVLIAKLFAFGGALAAAFAFERGDYLRRAWLLIAANYAFITFNTFIFGGGGRGSFFGWHPHLLSLEPTLSGQLNWICIIIGNVLAVVGAAMLARAWGVAGLERAGSATTRTLVILGAVAISLVLTGVPIVHAVVQAAHEGVTFRLFVTIATSGGDGLCFALVAPVMLTALALRGGVLWWPWALYTASGLSWMIFDVLGTGPRDTRLPIVILLSSAIRALACLLSFAAGMAQRWAVTAK